jgi:hypothetical protein
MKAHTWLEVEGLLGARQRGHPLCLPSWPIGGKKVAMIRVFELNHVWKFPSTASAGPEAGAS